MFEFSSERNPLTSALPGGRGNKSSHLHCLRLPSSSGVARMQCLVSRPKLMTCNLNLPQGDSERQEYPSAYRDSPQFRSALSEVDLSAVDERARHRFSLSWIFAALILAFFTGGLLCYLILSFATESQPVRTPEPGVCYFAKSNLTLYLRDSLLYLETTQLHIPDGKYFVAMMNTCSPYAEMFGDNLPPGLDIDNILTDISLATFRVDRQQHVFNQHHGDIKPKPGDPIHLYGPHSKSIDCCVIERPQDDVITQFLLEYLYPRKH